MIVCLSSSIVAKLENLDGSVAAIDHRFQHLRILNTITETTPFRFGLKKRVVFSLISLKLLESLAYSKNSQFESFCSIYSRRVAISQVRDERCIQICYNTLVKLG